MSIVVDDLIDDLSGQGVYIEGACCTQHEVIEALKQQRAEVERLRQRIAELTADCPVCHGLGCPPIGCCRAREGK